MHRKIKRIFCALLETLLGAFLNLNLHFKDQDDPKSGTWAPKRHPTAVKDEPKLARGIRSGTEVRRIAFLVASVTVFKHEEILHSTGDSDGEIRCIARGLGDSPR